MTRLLQLANADTSFPAPFRHRRIGHRYLLTNHAGQYAFLDEDAMQAFVDGALDKESSTYEALAEKNFVQAEVDIADLAARTAKRKRFIRTGPHLHIVEVTLRCNETCVYCHSSRAGMDEVGKDMSVETAEKIVDRIFETTSPSITIEFQGGEPLVNWPVVQRIIGYALEKNAGAGKALDFSLVTNLSLMDEEKLEYLLKHKVQICTSIDGPKALHNMQRILPGGDAHGEAVGWIERFNEKYAEAGLDTDVYHVEGLMTTTRETLDYPREVVDAYVDLGFRALFLRPVDPFGFANKTADQVALDPSAYLAFYREALDYIIELNKKGTQILERFAAIFLTKILKEEDPSFLDIRSPCGAAIGQVAYTTDGEIFVCDEARMLHRMGDDFFTLGRIDDTTYRETMQHETVRALTLASNLDGSPDCAYCAYNPYCGICPVYNYTVQGSLHGQQRTSGWCAVHMGILDTLFEKLDSGDAELLEVFERWVAVRPREHYVHVGGVGAATGNVAS